MREKKTTRTAKHFCEMREGSESFVLWMGNSRVFQRWKKRKRRFQTEPAQQPLLHERLPRGRTPVPLQRDVAILSLPHSLVMAKPALQRLKTRAVQRAEAVSIKTTAVLRELLKRKRPLTAGERGRKHAERSIGRELEHHAPAVSCCDCARGLLHRPPAGASAKRTANVARAGRGRRKSLLKGEGLLLSFHVAHRCRFASARKRTRAFESCSARPRARPQGRIAP